jgi:hypothetical protein
MHPVPPFDPPASLSYQLDKQYARFAARVSINDSSAGSRSAIIFAVHCDGKERWRSRGVLTNADAQEVDLAVHDVTALKLEVTTAEGDVGGAHGVWIEPHLTRAVK